MTIARKPAVKKAAKKAAKKPATKKAAKRVVRNDIHGANVAPWKAAAPPKPPRK